MPGDVSYNLGRVEFTDPTQKPFDNRPISREVELTSIIGMLRQQLAEREQRIAALEQARQRVTDALLWRAIWYHKESMHTAATVQDCPAERCKLAVVALNDAERLAPTTTPAAVPHEQA